MNYVVKLLCVRCARMKAMNVWSWLRYETRCAIAPSHYINDLIEMSFGGVKLRMKRKITVLLC